MVEEADPSAATSQAGLTCPRCGAPLPVPGADGFVTCAYCAVRTEVSELVPNQPRRLLPEEAALPPEPPLPPAEDVFRRGSPFYAVRAVLVIVVVVVALVALFVASQPPANVTGPSVANCSVSINASATSGPAPFAATFTADVTAPPGDIPSTPMWQFGPFGPGFDFNYTYGSTVTHTWNAQGSYGVHVTVPDSSLQGCWSTMSVNVT